MTTKTPFKRRGSFNSSNQVCERPNNFPPLYAMVSVKNTGINHPVLVDVVSGEIKPVEWKHGTTGTLEMARRSRTAYWPSPTRATLTGRSCQKLPVRSTSPFAGNTAKLTWQVHGGDITGIVVERQLGDALQTRGRWGRITQLPATATEYADPNLKKQSYGYRGISARDAPLH